MATKNNIDERDKKITELERQIRHLHKKLMHVERNAMRAKEQSRLNKTEIGKVTSIIKKFQ